MKMKTIRVGIMPRQQYKQRSIEMAKGLYKPKKDDPKVWFESVKPMAQTLSNENQNLSRTLKTLERYGIVELHKQKNALIPKVKATHFQVEFGLDAA